MNAITCTDLGRKFTSKNRIVEALKDVNITVKTGELFGLLGPNGAGKTTLIKVLTTLLLPTTGHAYVFNYDVTKEEDKIRPIINMVSGGEYSGYGLLTVKENLWMFSQFYGIPGNEAETRITALMERLHIAHMGNRKVRTLSTGERQRVNIIRAFMTNPKVVFLDEPTLGLDVETARLIRKFIKEWLEKDPERTVLLTTHYMMEADQLCDRIAIIHEGQIVALDTPSALKNLGRLNYVYKEEPTLEDVFLKLTGRGLE